jgi:hypothetical protein
MKSLDMLNGLTISGTKVYIGSGNCPTSSVGCLVMLIAQEFTVEES